MILTDLGTGKDNRWTGLFDATRVKPVAGAKAFIKGNSAVATHLVSGYLSRKPTSFDDLAPGEAAIMKIDSDNVAAFKDENGQVHSVSAVCSHMGCIVGWNETRSEEHTSELQSLMRTSYAVFCLNKQKNTNKTPDET